MRTRSSTAINGHLANAYLRFTARVTPCVDRSNPELIAPLSLVLLLSHFI